MTAHSDDRLNFQPSITHPCPKKGGDTVVQGPLHAVPDVAALPLKPPPAPPSLDTQETSEISPITAFLNEKVLPWEEQLKAVIGEDNAAVRFRHGGWWAIRQRVKASLFRCRETDSRIMAFCGCGGGAWIEHCVADPSRLRVRQNNCHDKLCTPCANARAFKIRTALMHLIEKKSVSFITLTLCGKGESLADLTERLRRSFKALRQLPIWQDAVKGGAAIMEIKWSDKARRWHPHLHIIADAKFMSQGELSGAWRAITKDSYIVDIRRVKNAEIAGSYVCKYASKPLNTSFSNSPELLDEAVKALKGQRLVLCFGDWYGTPLSDAENPDLADDMVDAGEWSMILPLHDVLSRASAGDAAAVAMLNTCGISDAWRTMLSRQFDSS